MALWPCLTWGPIRVLTWKHAPEPAPSGALAVTELQPWPWKGASFALLTNAYLPWPPASDPLMAAASPEF